MEAFIFSAKLNSMVRKQDFSIIFPSQIDSGSLPNGIESISFSFISRASSGLSEL
jgi:hypothetical protein